MTSQTQSDTGGAFAGTRPAKRGKVRLARRTILFFLLPFFVPFALFYVVPILYAIWQSLLKIQRGAGEFSQPTTVFGGLTQYDAVIKNGQFWASLGRTLEFGVVQVPVMLFLSLVIALLLDSTLVRGKAFFRIAAFLPYAIPGVIAAIMWSFLYHPQLSPIVDVLRHVGVNANFFAPSVVLWSIANVSTWLWTGYNMLIIYSALQAIPQEIYEAAKLDGAGALATALRIKIPIIVPALILTTVFSIIGTLQLYNEPSVLAQIAPSISSTFTPNMLVYSIAAGNNYQQAAAMSVVIAVATFILSFGFMRLTARRALQ